MHAFWEISASNSLVVAVLAVGVALLGRVWKNPVGLHLLWVLVLVKLIAPPLVTVPLALPMNQRPVTSEQHGTHRDAADQPPVTPGGLDERGSLDQGAVGSPAAATDAGTTSRCGGSTYR
ncbi:MAG TPA: hypothetical protein VMY37_10615 [Thermoguttaceae bacterium]|nr:hypothetical protein [Thermoguttaceae bacterium]